MPNISKSQVVAMLRERAERESRDADLYHDDYVYEGSSSAYDLFCERDYAAEVLNDLADRIEGDSRGSIVELGGPEAGSDSDAFTMVVVK